ncbi:hypothetical protein NHX12_031778 [Muraenolepis orangiensis]|uniref:Sacsin/Nov domain-containing protein n=1 Tax=Muraenolepis orangiensis TaxID=630683 RepID=A0A9Q0E6J1_9TELE|nr:hypothetical protein NHX12_031778 [Muraenolepis orangiensis]
MVHPEELIQNADDAGATKVVFIHDENHYGHGSILTDEFEKYQGPALYAYNNARFTSDDWKGIQATGRSVKRKDPNKVGRFGIGFNSVYHITDVFNVINIDAAKVTEYAEKYLPMDWKQGKEHVTWEIGNCLHPPAGWLQEFWKFLNIHVKKLSGFIGMPIIPIESQVDITQPMLLAKIQQNTTLIFQRSKQICLPEQIAKLVSKVGGTVVRGGEWLKHEDMDSYMLPLLR